MKSLIIALATLGPVGYLPASGTIASAFTIPLIYSVYAQPVCVWEQFAIIASLSVIALLIIQLTLEQFQRWDDPREIVLDEVVGMFIALCGIPLTPLSMLIGFFFFRVFDILKPFGIRKLECVGGALGILLDDMAAGLISCGLMHGIYWLIA
ncbi:phosphatidylglycerophosphatase A [Candidatus Dependentiae bacterium Noda2021]|nr:phosphatidylglycerophosphatase A [Candidatus Dependentiae bacterium Noda2021]